MTRAIFLSVVFVCVLASEQPLAAQDLVIANARIITGTGQVIEQGSIVVRSGKIDSVVTGPAPAKGVKVIDAKGMTAIAGFIDGHRHIIGGDAQRYLKEVDEYRVKLNEVQAERDEVVGEMTRLRSEKDGLEKPLTDAISNLKKVNDRFDAQVKLAQTKRWGWGDWLRNQFIIDAFAGPIKIQQMTNNNVPIDYNFMYVTRFDRCMSCHLAIDRPAYTREQLAALKEAPEGLRQRLDDARATLQRRRELIKDERDREQILDPRDLGDLRTLPHLQGRHVTEFAAHPRLDLFVDDNSAHPKEKFGCTICHGGQGSATAFNLASHTPNDAATLKRWHDD